MVLWKPPLVAVLPVLAVTQFHVIPEYCLVVVILAAAVSSIFWGVTADKRGCRPVILVLLGMLLMGPIFLCMGPSVMSFQNLAVVSCVLFGVLAGGLYPVGFAWLLESLPENFYGYASGAFARAYGLESLVGPLIGGLAVQRWMSLGLLFL